MHGFLTSSFAFTWAFSPRIGLPDRVPPVDQLAGRGSKNAGCPENLTTVATGSGLGGRVSYPMWVRMRFQGLFLGHVWLWAGCGD